MVTAAQRHTRRNVCPICNGHEGERRGKGERDWGFDSDDGEYTYCSRVQSPDYSPGPQAWRHKLNGDCRCGEVHGSYTATPPPRRERPPEHEPLDADTLNGVYQRLLELCPLKQEHRDFLLSRSTAPADLEAAERFGYGSLPSEGAEADAVIAALTLAFSREAIARVPGFFLRWDGTLTMHTARDGYSAILLPGRDEVGRIVHLVRMTVEDRKDKHSKYENFSGSHEVFTVAGEYRGGSRREARLVDGVHKAYVASIQDPGVIYVGLAGMALHGAALAAVRGLDPDVVIEALDAEKDDNPATAEAAKVIYGTVTAGGFRIEAATWAREGGKGIDDALASGTRIRFEPIEQQRSSNDGPCAEQAAHIERLQDQIAELRAEVARLKSLQTHQWRALRNEKVRPSERIGFCAAVAAVAEGTSHTGAEAARVPIARIAEQAGISETTAWRVVQKGAEWGLFTKEVVEGEGAAYTFHNRRTGQVEERYADITYIGLTAPVIETLENVVNLAPERKAHGGYRPRHYTCPDCGPEVDVLCVWSPVCKGCGAVLDEQQSHVMEHGIPAESSEFHDETSWEATEPNDGPSVFQDETLGTNGQRNTSEFQDEKRWERPSAQAAPPPPEQPFQRRHTWTI